MSQSGVDPQLLLGGVPISRGRLPNILIIFSRKPYEIKGMLVRSGGGGPKSATGNDWIENKVILTYLANSCSTSKVNNSFHFVKTFNSSA